MAPISASCDGTAPNGERIAALEVRTGLIERDLGTVGAVQIELRAVSTDVKYLTAGASALHSDVTELRKEVATATAASNAHVLAATAAARKQWPADAKAALCVGGLVFMAPVVPTILHHVFG